MTRILIALLLAIALVTPSRASAQVDIRTYGVVMDGTTVNTATFQAALDAGVPLDISGGVVVVSGDFTVSSKATALSGNGTIRSSTGDTTLTINALSSVTGITLDGVSPKLLAGGDHVGGTISGVSFRKRGIISESTANSWVEGVTVTGCNCSQMNKRIGNGALVQGYIKDWTISNNSYVWTSAEGSGALASTPAQFLNVRGGGNIIEYNTVEGGKLLGSGIHFWNSLSSDTPSIPMVGNIIRYNHLTDVLEDSISFEGEMLGGARSPSLACGTVAAVPASNQVQLTIATTSGRTHVGAYIYFYTGVLTGRYFQISAQAGAVDTVAGNLTGLAEGDYFVVCHPYVDVEIYGNTIEYPDGPIEGSILEWDDESGWVSVPAWWGGGITTWFAPVLGARIHDNQILQCLYGIVVSGGKGEVNDTFNSTGQYYPSVNVAIEHNTITPFAHHTIAVSLIDYWVGHYDDVGVYSGRTTDPAHGPGVPPLHGFGNSIISNTLPLTTDPGDGVFVQFQKNVTVGGNNADAKIQYGIGNSVLEYRRPPGPPLRSKSGGKIHGKGGGRVSGKAQ